MRTAGIRPRNASQKHGPGKAATSFWAHGIGRTGISSRPRWVGRYSQHAGSICPTLQNGPEMQPGPGELLAGFPHSLLHRRERGMIGHYRQATAPSAPLADKRFARGSQPAGQKHGGDFTTKEKSTNQNCDDSQRHPARHQQEHEDNKPIHAELLYCEPAVRVNPHPAQILSLKIRGHPSVPQVSPRLTRGAV